MRVWPGAAARQGWARCGTGRPSGDRSEWRRSVVGAVVGGVGCGGGWLKVGAAGWVGLTGW